jgi:cysteine desulfurase
VSAAADFCDHNAGAPALPEVVETFVAIERTTPGNPASAHASGRRSRLVLEESRERIAAAFGIAAHDIVFTSGGTEAVNMAVRGLGELREPVLLSPAEHPAVAEPAQQRGACWWSLDRTGQANVVPPAQTVGLVCLVHAQSELGTLQPVPAALALARDLGVPCLVDAAQTLGRVRVRPVLDAGAVVALSPHKAGGLRGHGVLLGRDLGRRLRPLLHGGGQELGLRPGTASPALAAANALAIELAECSVDERARSMAVVRQEFVATLQARVVAHELLTPMANSVPNTAMVRFVDVDGRNLLPSLDLAGVQASHGSACSSGAPTPPRVLTAIGLDDAAARACVRFSFGWNQCGDDGRRIAERTADVVLRLRKKI